MRISAGDLFTSDWLIKFQGWKEINTVYLYTTLEKDSKYRMSIRDNDYPILVTIRKISDNSLVYRQYVKTTQQYLKEVKCLVAQ